MLVLGTMAWASVRSQSPVSGIEYFQPGYSYRHLLNPAFIPLCGYVGIPVLGNLNASVGSNMGLSTLLYPLSDGSLGTFMHPEVDADAFMKKIHRRNYAGMDFQTALLSGGWFMGKSFWNVNVSVRGMLQMGLPYEFFEFAKKNNLEGIIGKLKNSKYIGLQRDVFQPEDHRCYYFYCHGLYYPTSGGNQTYPLSDGGFPCIHAVGF